MSGKRVIVASLFCVASLGWAGAALAQTTAAPPAVNANVWNGLDHQPTEASAPPLSAKREKKIDHKLSKLDQQLLNQKLPKVPPGAP